MNCLSACTATILAFGALDINHANINHAKSYVATRMLILVVCVCGMFNYYIYNAGLISYLMVETYDIPIKKLGDLLENPSYKLLVTGGYSEESFLKDSYDPSYRKIWENAANDNGMYN